MNCVQIAMAPGKDKFAKKIFKNHLLRIHKGDEAETLQNVHNNSLCKNHVFIAVAHVVSSLWHLKFPLTYNEKSKSISLQIF